MTRQRWMDVGLVALAALTVVMVVLALTQVGRSRDTEPVTSATAAESTPGMTRSPLPPGAPRAVFLGDSATAGVGAEGQPGWTTHVATAQARVGSAERISL